ncbi:MAG: hypothetical protein H7Y01_02350 [Ferruginibacter sp.]|nr:hypothetical protein [Chitinophagaceae bacterium]
MRKRTESAGMMGMSVPTILEQCDLQRTIKINDKKKLYYIEPFAKEEVLEEDTKPAAVKTPTVSKEKTTVEKGGVITMWYNITDTGERKKMNGFTARHVWTTQKMKPSPDACTMKDSLLIKTDGWYIDLPLFNCPIRYTPAASPMPTEKNQPQCKDRYITRRSGKGKLGFALTETRTIIMGNGEGKTSEFTMSLETLEFSSLKLDSMLFEIPQGYTQTMIESELQDKMDVKEMMNQYKNQNSGNNQTNPTEQKKAGGIRIGVYEPTGDGQLTPAVLQQYLASVMNTGAIEAMVISSETDAKTYNCDYTLATVFTKVKQASKAGGLIKAIKNADPNAASSFTIEATLTLVTLSDGSMRLQKNVSGKYDGKADEAAKKALEDGGRQVVSGLK